jgi:hypothetical protein
MRGMSALALLSAPLWLLCAVLADAGPAWRARYFPEPNFQGPVLERRERQLTEIFDGTRLAPGEGLDGRNFSARWDACLQLAQARGVPFQLVADGSARFVLDGVERLRVDWAQARGARGEVLQLSAGWHHLLVEFSTPGSGAAAPGVKLLAPTAGDSPCAAVP